jgi:Ca2+:H+ antiporter
MLHRTTLHAHHLYEQEVVVALQALHAGQIRVVQASLMGSVFSNMLLVLGCCFFFGGLRFKEQTFNSTR